MGLFDAAPPDHPIYQSALISTPAPASLEPAEADGTKYLEEACLAPSAQEALRLLGLWSQSLPHPDVERLESGRVIQVPRQQGDLRERCEPDWEGLGAVTLLSASSEYEGVTLYALPLPNGHRLYIERAYGGGLREGSVLRAAVREKRKTRLHACDREAAARMVGSGATGKLVSRADSVDFQDGNEIAAEGRYAYLFRRTWGKTSPEESSGDPDPF